MKRIIAIIMLLIISLSGCDTSKEPPESNNGILTQMTESDSDTLKAPTYEEVTEIQIDSIDKMNYYSAVHVLTKTRQTYGVTPLTADIDADEEIYYYELTPDDHFSFGKVSIFQIELTDENGFLASKLGVGTVDVVISEECIWGDSLITLRNKDRFFSCLSNGWSGNGQEGSTWDFSTHKYVDGFNIVKNFEQENYSFIIDTDISGQVLTFECRGSQNGGYRADKNIKVVSTTSLSDEGGSYTIAELEEYFKNENEL